MPTKPLHLMLILSQACPVSCATSFGPQKGGLLMQRTTMETVTRWQNDLASSTMARNITFHGGQPLVPGTAFHREMLPLLYQGSEWINDAQHSAGCFRRTMIGIDRARAFGFAVGCIDRARMMES